VWDNTDTMANYSSVALSSSDYQYSLQSQVKGSGSLGFGLFSRDMYIYQSYEKLKDVQSTNMRSASWYDIELSPIVQVDFLDNLTPWAKTLFSNLGQNISDPKVKQTYLMALEMYGDSLVTRVSMGGRLYFKAFLNNDTVNNITVDLFQEETAWSFFGLFGSKSAYDYYEQQVSDTVKAQLVGEVLAEGGVWKPTDLQGLKMTPTGFYSFALKDIHQNILDWDTFVVSIKDNLVPVRYQIVPMYQMFIDPVISKNFQIVTQEYLKSKISKRF